MQVRHATVQINNQRAEQAKTRTINALLTASIPHLAPEETIVEEGLYECCFGR